MRWSPGDDPLTPAKRRLSRKACPSTSSSRLRVRKPFRRAGRSGCGCSRVCRFRSRLSIDGGRPSTVISSSGVPAWNDEASKLGSTPLPDGMVRLFRENGREGQSFVTQQYNKYVPIGQEIELNLGRDPEVIHAPWCFQTRLRTLVHIEHGRRSTSARRRAIGLIRIMKWRGGTFGRAALNGFGITDPSPSRFSSGFRSAAMWRSKARSSRRCMTFKVHSLKPRLGRVKQGTGVQRDSTVGVNQKQQRVELK